MTSPSKPKPTPAAAPAQAAQPTVLNTLANVQVEQMLIGNMLYYPHIVERILGIVRAEDFALEKCRMTMAAIEGLHAEHNAIDIATVAHALKGRDQLELIGGDMQLHKWRSDGQSANAPDDYARIIKDYSTRRALYDAGTQLQKLANRHDLSVNAIVSESNGAVGRATQNSGVTPAKLVSHAVREFQASYKKASASNVSNRFFTGLEPLDDPALLGGIEKGRFSLLGGGTGMGKTALAVSIALRGAEMGQYGLFISKEMTAEEMASRFIAAMTGISLTKMRKYTQAERAAMTEAQRRRVTMTAEEEELFATVNDDFAKLPLGLKYMPSFRISDVWAEARRIKEAVGRIDYVIVDQWHEMPPDEQDFDIDKHTQIAKQSHRLKMMAQNLDTALLVLSQLSGDAAQRKRPPSSAGDLRESQNKANEADIVLFLHRAGRLEPDKYAPSDADVIVAKNRAGDVGKARLFFHAAAARFLNPLPEDASNSETAASQPTLF